jgi:putative ABC transport system permease protein
MELWRDILYACRMLLRSPVLTAVVVLSLALGSGANSAIFSVVDAVLRRPLPYPHSERLVTLWENDATAPAKTLPFSVADFFDFQAQSRKLSGIEGFHPWSYNLTGKGDPERIVGGVVTAGLFPLLGPAPLLGRNFRPEEDRPGGDPVAILSYDLWRRRFGADQGSSARSSPWTTSPTPWSG